MTNDVKLPFGLSQQQQQILHISEVPSGLACDCVCTGCEATLVARKGKRNAHHFAHHKTDDCGRALESALHLFAKELIGQSRKLLLPSVLICDDQRTHLVCEAKEISFDSVVLEQKIDAIRPDIIATLNGRDLLIEVAVTHFCGDDKIQKIKELGLSAIEIDLSDIPWEATKEEITDAILSGAPREWLVNSKQDAAQNRLDERLKKAWEEQQVREERERKEKARRVQRQGEILIRVIRELPSPSFIPPHSEQDIARVVEWGLDSVTGIKVQGGICFSSQPKIWQSSILNAFIIYPLNIGRTYTKFTTKVVLDWMKKNGLLRIEFSRYIHDAAEQSIQSEFPDFQAPYKALAAYLDYLEQHDVLFFHQGRWHPSSRIGCRYRRP